MKKPVLIFSAFLIWMAAVATAYAGPENSPLQFSDLKNSHWAHNAISKMAGDGIITGYPDGTFKPSGAVTYGEFIKMALIVDMGKDVGNTSIGHWATLYYEEAVKKGYFNQYDINKQQLSLEIPRGDVALILSAILGEKRISNYDSIQAQITDVDATTSHDFDIVKAFASGILMGYEDGTFRPEGTLSRAEAATVMLRLKDESARILPEGKKPEEPKEDADENDIGAVIRNYKTFEQKDIDMGFGSDLADATGYEFITDMSKYEVTKHTDANNRYTWININGKSTYHLGWGNMYLMKNNEIVEFSGDGQYKEDIEGIEYFVFTWYKGVEEDLGIMPNPLYVKK